MTTHRLPTILLSTGLCAVFITGCGSASEREPAEPTPTPSASASAEHTPGDGTFLTPMDANRNDADSTAETAALMLHSWDTTTDTTETAAAVRAKPLMSEEWAAQQIEPERNVSQAEWLEPAKHEAYSDPILTPGQGDAAAHDYGPDRAERRYQVTWTWQGRDDSTMPSSTSRSVVVFLERHDGKWEVVGHDTTVIPGQSKIEDSTMES